MKAAWLALAIGVALTAACRRSEAPADAGAPLGDSGSRTDFFMAQPRLVYALPSQPMAWFSRAAAGQPKLFIERSIDGQFAFYEWDIRGDGLDQTRPAVYLLKTEYGSWDSDIVPTLSNGIWINTPIWNGLNPGRNPAWIVVHDGVNPVRVTDCSDSIAGASYAAPGGAVSDGELWVGFARDCDLKCSNGYSTQLYELSLGDGGSPRMHCLPDYLGPLVLHPKARLGASWKGHRLRIFEFERMQGSTRQIEATLAEATISKVAFIPGGTSMLVMNDSSDGTRFWDAIYVDGKVSLRPSELESHLSRLDYVREVGGKVIAVGWPKVGGGPGIYALIVLTGSRVTSRAVLKWAAARAPEVLEENGEIVVVYEESVISDGGPGFRLWGVRPSFGPVQ